MHNVILASASPARLATLRAAGVEPEVITSSVDEPAVVAQALQENPDLHASDEALLLARAKAEDVAGRDAHSAHTDQIVIGCDSILEFDGQSWGKPLTAERARERWRMMRGKSGVLHSGHWIIAGDRASGVTVSTTVFFADISDQEIDAYVASGEPLRVAGGFTIDGRGGWFIEKIAGDHHSVVGISLPAVREVLREMGIAVTKLWA